MLSHLLDVFSAHRICPMQWMLLKSQTNWDSIHYVTATGTFKLLVQQAEMVFTKVWTGCPISSRVQIVKFLQFTLLTISGCPPLAVSAREIGTVAAKHNAIYLSRQDCLFPRTLDVLLRIMKWSYWNIRLSVVNWMVETDSTSTCHGSDHVQD